MKMASFEKLKSDWNQTWFIDIIYIEPSCGQRSSEVKLQYRLKM